MATPGKALILGVGFLGAVLGCGARTDTLLFDGEGGLGGNGEETGMVIGGTHSVGGGGYGNSGGYGEAGLYTAGSVGVGGSGPTTAGTGFGGFGAYPTAGNGGSISMGGHDTGGSSGVSGSGQTAGTGFGGFGAVAGIGAAGTGGTSVIVQSCVAAAQSACNKCQCETCGSALDACVGDPSLGCAKIILCIQITQCNGLACYPACKTVIDANGGLAGNSVSQAFSLGACVVNSSSSCGCN
jgi:hypothetical protein